ncbi:hypothetical protein MSTO_10540 [Mycobacterium stomatepiae]|uniref:Uncharacterized protein n=1 Tax=Mycobacterium stomatepiae TaxID=470076 RepID=A0A7I7Q3M4_9MYCO|nr:hypothetical protein [Mycobacterium stomatepiae]BBY20849.1 hypothetical protein MSTO_10540 [Mycobacterium stomatepiae]
MLVTAVSGWDALGLRAAAQIPVPATAATTIAIAPMISPSRRRGGGVGAHGGGPVTQAGATGAGWVQGCGGGGAKCWLCWIRSVARSWSGALSACRAACARSPAVT